MDMEHAKHWLSQHAFPLWLKQGVDAESGAFVENLTLAGEPLPAARRAMVQARQLYSFRIALEQGLCDPKAGKKAVERGTTFFMSHYSLPSGAFRHSIGVDGKPLDESTDLYGQAFALFGLANAYAVLGQAELKDRAMALREYLFRERKLAEGGFSESEAGRAVYRSNPHMHLFEAAIAWMELDADPVWHALAAEVLHLCLARFIDPVTGALGEFFSEGWVRELEQGKFVYEPGHLYEWSWLMGRFQNFSGRELRPVRLRLFELAELTGICPVRRAVFDQIWSDFTPKLRSSRFWPQCERIKAAAQLGFPGPAQEGMAVLFRYFELPVAGLWYDTWETNGNFRMQAAKASSLYHIVGAITEAQVLEL